MGTQAAPTLAVQKAPERPPPPKRFREALGSIIARLQQQLQVKQQALDDELQENFRHRVTGVLVPALTACVHAFSCSMREGVGAAEGALAEADARAAAVVRMIGSDAPLPGDLGQRGAPWPAGALGMPPSDMIRELMSYRARQMDRPGFLAHMKDLVHELALLLQHLDAGDPDAAPELAKVTRKFVLSMCGYQLHPWGASVLALDLNTGEPAREATAEATREEYLRIALASRATDRDLLVFRIVNRWWKETARVLLSERRNLAAAALKAPDDIALQDEVNSALAEVNTSYVYYANAAGVILCTVVNAPERVAMTWVAAWPRYCVLTSLLEAYESLAAERARGSPSDTATAVAPPTSDGANGADKGGCDAACAPAAGRA